MNLGGIPTIASTFPAPPSAVQLDPPCCRCGILIGYNRETLRTVPDGIIKERLRDEGMPLFSGGVNP